MEPRALRATEPRYCTGSGDEVATTVADVDAGAEAAGTRRPPPGQTSAVIDLICDQAIRPRRTLQ